MTQRIGRTHLETRLVDGDHGDVIGHYHLERAVAELSRSHHSYDLLKSDSGFPSDVFRLVWGQIFAFCSGSSLLTCVAFTLCILGLGSPSYAQEPPQPASSSACSPPDLAGFVDGAVSGFMRNRGTAGVTVAVVDRSGPILLLGYGIASQSPARPVVPGTTMFRIGSISKTFTYVAAMQLVEAGKLDLSAEANQYLPAALHIPGQGLGPVRVHHLMEHNAGFEDASVPHLFVHDPSRALPLEQYLASYRPKRVRPAGTHADYSNYSVGLLGAIIANVSGMAYDDYVEKHLLEPLGMKHTSFREPLTATAPMAPALAGDVSAAFLRQAGGFKEQPFEYVSAHPAGSCSSSAGDMARWMGMLLGAGALGDVRVLQPATFEKLATVSFRNAPDVTGIAHGFFRARYGRYESLEHNGGTFFFFSSMVVLPEAGVGIFLSTNTDTGAGLSRDLPALVFERLLPDARDAAVGPPAADFQKTAARFTGTYLSERRAYSTLEKMVAAMSPVKVSSGSDGTLRISGGGRTTRYAQEGPLTFRSTESSARIQFLQNGKGAITGFAAAGGSSVAEKVGMLGKPDTLVVVVVVLVLVCVGTLLGFWGRRGRKLTQSRSGRAAAIVIAIAAAAWPTAVLLFATGLSGFESDLVGAFANYPGPMLVIATGLGYACAALAVAGLALGALAWRSSGWTLGRRIRHMLVVAVMLCAVAILVQWNVLFAPFSVGQ